MGTEHKYYPGSPPSYAYDNPQIPEPQGASWQAPGHPYGTQSTTNVVVVNQQPVADTRMIVGSVNGHRDWSTDLCACMSDTGGCKLTVCYVQFISFQTGFSEFLTHSHTMTHFDAPGEQAF